VCVGTVGKEAAEITHLRWGTLVVTGGHDRLCAAYAARGKEPLLVDSTGSAEAVVLPIERYAAPNPAVSGFVACYADVVPGQYVLSARVGYAGALVDWYWREVRARGVGANHPTVDAEIDWPLSFSGLLCYPSFGRVLAPTWDSATASGAILGLTLGHRQSHLLQALIEGVGYSLRANVEWLERCVGRAIPTIRVEGALTGSRVWMQLKADVTGRRVEGLRLEEATALGAALLAGVGAGIYPDCDAATAVVARDLETWMPTAELAATYSDVFEHGFQRLPRLISEIAVALEQAAGHRDRDSGA
jgi:xylulokinase